VRIVCLLLALLISTAVAAQDKAKKKQLVHKKATPEQIRKFNALQKKQQGPKKKQQEMKRAR
jgi:hypothetical protein